MTAFAKWVQPRDVSLLLLVLAALLFAFQYVTLGKFAVFPNIKHYPTFAQFWQNVCDGIALGPTDAALAIAILGVCGTLIGLEVRRRRLSHFFAGIFASEKKTVTLLVACGVVLMRPYLAAGQVGWGGDSAEHIAYGRIVADAFASGEFPIWTNYFASGSPLLQLYGSLYFYLVGSVNLLVRDFYMSVKLVLVAGHVGSGLAMYLFCRTVCRSRRAGFLAGLAYILSFWHLQQVLIMGRQPLSVFYALLPLPFYFFEQSFRRFRSSEARPIDSVAGGCVLGLLAFTHPGYAFWATLFMVFYIALRIATDGGTPRALVRFSLQLAGGGLLMGSSLTVPMWLERGATMLHRDVSFANVPSPTLEQLLVWSNHHFRLLSTSAASEHWYGGYLGLSLIVIALVGLVLALRHHRRDARPVVAASLCLALALALVFGYHWTFVSQFSVVHGMAAGRYLLFVVFFLAMLVGMAAKHILQVRGGRRSRLFTLMLFVILADLGPTTFQHLYLPDGMNPTAYSLESVEKVRVGSKALANGELPPYRLCTPTARIHPFLAVSWAQFHTGFGSVQGVYGESTRTIEFTTPWALSMDAVVASLRDNTLDPLARKVSTGGIRLFNIKHVLYPTSGDREETEGSVVLTWPSTSPVIVSPRIQGYVPASVDRLRPALEKSYRGLDVPEKLDAFVDAIAPIAWIILATELHPERDTCERIIVDDFQGQRDLGTDPRVEVIEHRVWNQKVRMWVRLSAASYARLAYSWYPFLRVRVNGVETEPLRTADHFMALRLEAGEHEITIEPYLSPLRCGLLFLQVGWLVASAFYLWRHRRRD